MKNHSEDADSAKRTYRLEVVSEFDADGRGLPPGPVEQKLEYAAVHSGLPGETWRLVDPETNEVIHEYDIGE